MLFRCTLHYQSSIINNKILHFFNTIKGVNTMVNITLTDASVISTVLNGTTKRAFLDSAICKNHNGKMDGMQSLSTSCVCNSICQARHNTNDELCICKHCYSFRQLKRMPSLANKLERNTAFLTNCELTADDVPTINCQYFRFEAFGELQNALQVKNYFLIAEVNKNVNFALWTKNLFVLDDAFQLYGLVKPSNLNIVYSDPYMNKCLTSEDKRILKAVYPYIDKVFTVHNKKSALPSFLVNCGQKKCKDCLLCYTKNDVFVINELLK